MALRLPSLANIRVMAIFIFLTDVIVLVVVLALLWNMAGRKDDTCAKLCLPCADNKNKICCSCHVPTLKSFLTKTFNDTLTTEKQRKTETQMPNLTPYMDVSWNLKPTAHITGSKISTRYDGGRRDLYPVREWDKDGNNCLMQNGMEYRNGRLVVPATGFYHLYGFLDLHQTYDDKASMPPDMPSSITMRFYKYNILKPDEEGLIETLRPYERSANRQFMVYQSFLGADVHLEAGDEVYLKVSNLTYIKNPSRNVFGLHML
ncbi:tumor necrosis factor ligand superfamily member 15-like [Saccostrea echinata]|uniref:tumor necrosis factor ligand superfamily member 15-like n=1 Tax=Saccostrea echinata TaxID=191078 RepID=UPI002A800F9A|nr:tumor necrosis factor ligand superfamily member 15-like [Saccostrea echinata]